MPYYAVAKGRKEGVYTTWSECEQQVKKFSGAVFKKFPTLCKATDFLIKHQANIIRNDLENEYSGNVLQQLNGLQTTLARAVKQEKPEVSKTVKEPLSTSLLINDNDADKDLLRVLRELEEGVENTKVIKIDHYVFNANQDDYINVYIGGHAENVGSWNCMAGYGIYFGKNHALNVAEAATGRMTRNVGDIEAAIEAIEIAIRVGIAKLCVHTKSEFLLNAVGFWMNSWKRNDWRNKHGKVVQNRKQFEKLYALLNDSNIIVKLVDARNELCTSNWRQVKKLAEMGTEDYLDQHPNKEEHLSMESFDDFDY
ncbi:ribonuclease H1 [Zeugodacus cucurbitae]|uniref:Ribonuclease H1 n=1 Tax=Zeugodacus cucurbitae TaxID=28588 RepID=A0A0A1X733_ZEUCU|nr:ribonuclease H1 [Zeugodacus cucurbitae]